MSAPSWISAAAMLDHGHTLVLRSKGLAPIGLVGVDNALVPIFDRDMDRI